MPENTQINKPCLVLLPGLDGSGLLFEPLLKELNKDFDCRVEPLNGLPKSLNEQIPYFENKYGSHEIHLLAESFSGHIAYELATNSSLKINTLTFLASFLGNPNVLTRLSSFFPIKVISKPLLPKALIAKLLFGRYSNVYLQSLFFQSLSQTSDSVLLSRLRILAKLDKPNTQVDIPSLYIQAKNDWLVSKKRLDIFLELFNNLEMVKCKGTHFIAQTNPKQSAKAITDFIKNRK